MHHLARQLRPRVGVQVVTQWDARRTDWLWGTTLDAPKEAATYEVDGRQYVVVAAGGGSFLASPPGTKLVAFALPAAP